MSEFLSSHEDNLEKTGSGHTVLLAEPLYRRPESNNEGNLNTFLVPKGSEHWAYVVRDKVESIGEEALLFLEYSYICDALQRGSVPFRMIIAHRNLLNEAVVVALMAKFKVRGLSLDPNLPSVGFPRDMMVDVDGVHFLNPEANFKFPDGKGVMSPMGEGGAVLKAGNKIFVADPSTYTMDKRPRYKRDIDRVSKKNMVGFLPHPIGVEVDIGTGLAREFLSNHPDRVTALVKGKDNNDYLLVDRDYFEQKRKPWGKYSRFIADACKQTQTNLMVIERGLEDTPYSLNLEQFRDGSVVMTSGHKKLQETVTQIVGQEKVVTTKEPIIAYPILRHGGIRCMILISPLKIVGEPLVPNL